ncbi:hypothetical protein OIU84_012520 [Salix udensis]|uniref:UV-stimulated scaffold protein A C-terminal domain-containing protein n=1 Tax=Salix udensis TaxID=889485 RepID=A0AAD6NSY6_9ROSI|nr:hypothetical protein OIU84_012520 [Salix udensis]
MAGAPVIERGSFLDTWGSNRDVLANHRGLDLESHRGRVDDDAVIPAKKIAGLNLQATLYKEDQVGIQPCRAPLRKGGHCRISSMSRKKVTPKDRLSRRLLNTRASLHLVKMLIPAAITVMII